MIKILLVSAFFLLAACSRDYTPASSAIGESIFKEACAECHQPKDPAVPQVVFSLNEKNANERYITHKVQGGSLMMPKFPNITGSKMRSLSTYVLNHSVAK